jgi:hypothetical protein
MPSLFILGGNMKKQIADWKLVILWDDDKREIFGNSLPECVTDEINTYLNELEDLRSEHDLGLRWDDYPFAHDRDKVDAMEWNAYTAPKFEPVED